MLAFLERIYSLTLVIILLLWNRTFHHVYSQSLRLSLWRRKPKLATFETFTTTYREDMAPAGLGILRQRTQTSYWNFASDKNTRNV